MNSWSESLIVPLRDTEWLISTISEITGQNPDCVRQRLRNEHFSLPHEVPREFFFKKLTPYVYDERMVRFYEETDSFLYEIIGWNRLRMKCVIREWILARLQKWGVATGRILLCGDGIGVDSFYFAQNGYDVTSFEVSCYGVAFAKKMFAGQPFHVSIADSLESLTPGTFDAVLCLDVLEHLPDPLQAVQQLASLLRPGGFFFASSPFYLVAKAWPTHLRSNRKFAGKVRVFEKAGTMKWVDGRFLQNPIVFQRLGAPLLPPLSIFRFLFLGYGSCWLRIFAAFPRLTPFVIRRLFRWDRQLQQLRPFPKSSGSTSRTE